MCAHNTSSFLPVVALTRFSGAASFLALLSLASAAAINHPRADAAECQFKEPGGPLLVTTDCIDPQYNSPIITNETDETHPVPHRRIQGHFNGTTVDFNIYLPPHEVWKGRFFQEVYPLQNSSASEQALAFGYASGGYTIQNKGLQGYRAEAAVAKLSRRVARDYYKEPSRSIYGYVYGGSGGSYQTIGAMENTFGVWDGSLTYVQATKYSNPNNWPIRAISGLFLTDKKELIRDAMAPGGSGDPSSILNKAQRAVFEETAALGVPFRAWEDYEGVGQNKSQLWGSLINQVGTLVKGLDPTYVDDFWTSPGYLGTEKSEVGDFFRAALVEFNTTVKDVTLSNDSVPTEFIVDEVPTNISVVGLDLAVVYKNGSTGAFVGRLDAKSKTVYIEPGTNAAILTVIKSGAKIHVDNRLYLSVHSLYRHQLPPKTAGFYAFDFLRNAKGEPRYPQRKSQLAEMISKSTSGGGNQTGKLTGKVMVLDNLLDYDAFPWQADWYRTQVKNALGDKFDDNYRLYYADNSDHFSGYNLPADTLRRLVPYWGLMEQHLRDLSRWVEKGTPPPKPTRYTVIKGQVHVPTTAAERRGIQPVVDLTANGAANKTKARVGQAVTFKLHAAVPPNTGKIVKVEWDFDGVGKFVEKGSIGIKPAVDTKVSHTFSKPGKYIVGAKVTNQREGNKDTPLALVQNIGRVRVEVV
ncbi:hypothetical protein QWA68_014943 [Fusarium oxysporum]|nr:hypothetical protein QWA68_014943 [Fusarium oxysporum]